MKVDKEAERKGNVVNMFSEDVGETIEEKINFIVRKKFRRYNEVDENRDIAVLVNFYRLRKQINNMPKNKAFANHISEVLGWGKSTSFYRIRSTTDALVRYVSQHCNDSSLREVQLNCKREIDVTILERFYKGYMIFW